MHFNQVWVYVYKKSGTDWNLVNTLFPPNPEFAETFGFSLSVEGDMLAVGSINDRINNITYGAVYIYNFNGTEWALNQTIYEPSVGPASNFGRSVCIDNNNLIIGAINANVINNNGNTVNNAGAAFIYKYEGNSWVLQDQLQANDLNPNSSFGIKVSMNGNTALVSDSGGREVVYVFELINGEWTQNGKLYPQQINFGNTFGYQVFMHETEAFISYFGGVDKICVFEYNDSQNQSFTNCVSPTYPTATDNCDGEITAVPYPSLPIQEEGEHVIEWTYTDNSGNASTQYQIIEIEDNTLPVALCTSVTATIQSNGLATITADDVDAGSTDNCGASHFRNY